MKLSESLRKGVMESFAGGITNRFKMRGRRDVLVFEEILALYLKECEGAGRGGDVEATGRRFGALTLQEFLPSVFRSLPTTMVANKIGNAVWKNVGLLDSMAAEKNGDTATLRTQNEYISRVVGKNRFLAGVYAGIFETLEGRKAKLSGFGCSGKTCTYTFTLQKEPAGRMPCKGKRRYDELNAKFPGTGRTLKDGIRMRTFALKGNAIFFRGCRVIPVECTLFHILGAEKICLDELAAVSEKFFLAHMKPENAQSALPFIRKALQIMGWGTVSAAPS
jgi:hypothetical protein